MMRCLKIALLLVFLLNFPSPVFAKIYKYQKGGIWYYTDTAPAGQANNMSEMGEEASNNASLSMEDIPLFENDTTKSGIEKASGATVTINSALSFSGFANGFFISNNGYILTSKHAILPSPEKGCSGYSESITMSCFNNRLAREKSRLKREKEKLKQLKLKVQREHDLKRRQFYEKRYQTKKKNLDDWLMYHANQSQEFNNSIKKTNPGKRNSGYLANISESSLCFTISLANGEELYVRLVKESTLYDLALLKLDGYKTPKLEPGSTELFAQGDTVYAIGRSRMLKDSIIITSGTFTRMKGVFIHTNILVTTYNLGGPLVDPAGAVLGINTQIRANTVIEGAGFATSIQTALKEFGHYLP